MTDQTKRENLLPRNTVAQRVTVPRFHLSEEARQRIERNIERRHYTAFVSMEHEFAAFLAAEKEKKQP